MIPYENDAVYTGKQAWKLVNHTALELFTDVKSNYSYAKLYLCLYLYSCISKLLIRADMGYG